MSNESEILSDAPIRGVSVSQNSDALSGLQVKLKERYLIDFGEPIETLDVNGAKAYKVSDRIDSDKLLFALICSHDTTPRHSILPYIKSLKSPHLLSLIEYGTIKVPHTSEISMALIYQRPLGGRVIDDTSLPFRENPEKLLNLGKNILYALRDLNAYGITHRAIRLQNLFYLDETKENIVLGDCIASFPAYHQPAVYEAIETLIAKKESRGSGTDKNDVYSLGVVLLFLYIGKENWLDVSLEEILSVKLKKGSYAALSNDNKIQAAFANILRNMLIDNPINRWGITNALELLENKNSKISYAPVQETLKKALTISGQKYYTVRDVSYALQQNPKEAFELYNSGKIAEWIKNSLEFEELAHIIDKAVKSTVDNSPYHELSIAKICIYLTPYFPIKIGKTTLFPDALSKSLYYAYTHHEDLNDYARFCSYDLIRLWYSLQNDSRANITISDIRGYAASPAIGYGLERVMYELDDDIPCISKLLANDYVSTPTRILRVLDANYNNSQEKPYDNNLIAYLRSKMGKKIDGIIIDLNSKISALEASAILRLFTTMQNKFGPQELPKLAQWLSVFSMPLIKSYHNVRYQKFLEKELLKINKSGRLYEMQELLENEEARKKDTSEFNIARKTVAKLLAEKNMLISSDNKWEDAARDMAIKGACLLAVVVMIISFVVNFFRTIKL
ncbi:MAG: hypothetical protein IJ660_01275 [Alphaproteobacteria bacterium]|nr:hypothetical protein [Alphaproteobacteria bacterium]